MFGNVASGGGAMVAATASAGARPPEEVRGTGTVSWAKVVARMPTASTASGVFMGYLSSGENGRRAVSDQRIVARGSRPIHTANPEAPQERTRLGSAGAHPLTVHALDPGVTLDRFEIALNGAAPAYRPMPETRITSK